MARPCCPALRCVAVSPVDRLFSTAGKSCFYSSGPVNTAQRRFFWAASVLLLALARAPPPQFCISRIPDRGPSLASLCQFCFDGRLRPLETWTWGPSQEYRGPGILPPTTLALNKPLLLSSLFILPFPPVILPALPPSTSHVWIWHFLCTFPSCLSTTLRHPLV